MSLAILNLVSNVFMTSFAFIGIGTVINKVGKFCKIIEENKKDSFKAGFDSIMIDSVEELNRCVESVSLITNNTYKIVLLMFDISTGNKFIKKDKDGKIIICNKSKMVSGYKDKISELSTKVKKYEEELNKINKNPNKTTNNKDDDDSDNSSSDDSSDISLSSSDDSSDNKQSNNLTNNDEFILG